jgi:ATPase family associated with various cellular activities (AAA)
MDRAGEDSFEESFREPFDERIRPIKSRSEKHSEDRPSDQTTDFWLNGGRPSLIQSKQPENEKAPPWADRMVAPDPTTEISFNGGPTPLMQSKQVENEKELVEGLKPLRADRMNTKDSAGKTTESSIVTIKRLTISDDQSTGSASKGRIVSALRPRHPKLRETQQKWPELPPPNLTGAVDPSSPLAAQGLPSLQNHVLQDYQMQLFLLEQQNKKRLMMAREHERAVSRPTQPFLNSLSTSPRLPPDTPGRRLPSDTLGAPFDRSMSTLAKANAFSPDETSSVNLENLANGLDNEVLVSGPPHSKGPNLESYIIDLQKKAKAFDDLQALREPRRHEVLYRIQRGSDVSTYFDRPTWVQGQKKRMLRSTLPLANLSSYLEKHCDLAFVVYKDFDITELEAAKGKTMSDESRENDIISEVSNTNESILPVSRDLCAAITALLRSRSEFSQLLGWYESMSLLPGPYLAIYYSRSVMDGLMQTLSEGCQKQLCLLLEYVSSQFGDEYAAADDLLSRGRISLPYLKYLYKPNDVLVEGKGDDCMGFVSRTWPLNMRLLEYSDEKYLPSVCSDLHKFKEPTRTGCRICEIEAWSWKFDGTFYRETTLLTLELGSNDNVEKNIADLNIRPVKYVTDEVRDLLNRRGEIFWSCRFRHFVSYKENRGRDCQATSDERYMIDLETYHELHSEGKLKSLSRRAISGHPEAIALPPEFLDQETPPGDNFVFLLPLTIKGYNLRRKKWVDLRVDQITEVTWNKEAFKSLVLDRKTKDVIQALISNQLDAEKSTDLISGKGNGLILLLHGGPGTGKTFTAESVAEIAEKPLYRVTCGDIGTEADEVEKYLESVLNLGKVWGCVVLLDEADVFLEQRSLEDLPRNALVSVFLRVLEYYDGILVLTSNRVGTFDEAFKSRIQLALHYPNLGPFQRLKIWESFIVRLERLGEDRIDFDDLKDHLEELAMNKMNGRQIRNAITTTRQYAQWKKAVLTYSHLKDVIEISGRFDLYLDKLNGGYTQDQLAEDEGLRLSQAP